MASGRSSVEFLPAPVMFFVIPGGFRDRIHGIPRRPGGVFMVSGSLPGRISLWISWIRHRRSSTLRLRSASWNAKRHVRPHLLRLRQRFAAITNDSHVFCSGSAWLPAGIRCDFASPRSCFLWFPVTSGTDFMGFSSCPVMFFMVAGDSRGGTSQEFLGSGTAVHPF